MDVGSGVGDGVPGSAGVTAGVGGAGAAVVAGGAAGFGGGADPLLTDSVTGVPRNAIPRGDWSTTAPAGLSEATDTVVTS